MNWVRRPGPLMSLLALGLLSLVLGTMSLAGTTSYSLLESARGLLAAFGMSSNLPQNVADILELRLWRALTSAGVGASLALSGALLQGVFRNGLAAPSIIGVTAGASLGATTSILFMSGLLPLAPFAEGFQFSSIVIVLASFAGALLSVGIVVFLASERGRVSIPSLLLTGIAVNACLAGLLSASQALSLQDAEVSRVIFTWTFGNLDDKSEVHVLISWIACIVGALAIPRLAIELDLFAGGEDDARALGVATGRTKVLAIIVASLLAASAVSVAGPIAFVGLVVPHLIRLLVGASHQAVLPLSLLGGAVFLCAAECVQLGLLGDAAFRPGVFMSLIGGPFFLVLLWRRKGSLRTW